MKFFRRKTPQPVRITYVVPDGEDDAGMKEGLWAMPLGNQLYQLQNIPVLAEELNVEDIVRCKEVRGERPIIVEVVKRSGNRTFRVLFRDEVPDTICRDVVKTLNQHKAIHEQVTPRRYVFNVAPTDNHEWVRSYLTEKEEEGVLWLYENDTGT